MSKPVLAAIFLVALLLGAIVATSLTGNNSKYRVEVCMAFNGAKQCKTVRAATHDEALRTASDNACSMLTNGQAEFERCRNTPPVLEKWLNNGQ